MHDSFTLISFLLIYSGLAIYTVTRLATLPVKARNLRNLSQAGKKNR